MEIGVIGILLILLALLLYPLMSHQVKKAKDTKVLAAISAIRSNLIVATANLQGDAPVISGGSTGTLYTLVYGGTLYGENHQTTLIKGIDPTLQALFTNFSSTGSEAILLAGKPSKIAISYHFITSGTATVTFNAGQGKNSLFKQWSAL